MKSMIVKHFNQYKWELPDEQENIDYKYSTPDPNEVVEWNKRQIIENTKISDNKRDEKIEVRAALIQ